MTHKRSEAYVFSHIEQADGHRFVPCGILGLTETGGANLSNRELASDFAYGTGYLARPQAFELDPVSLAFADREGIKGKVIFPVNGLNEFGGLRDAAPDAWGPKPRFATMRARSGWPSFRPRVTRSTWHGRKPAPWSSPAAAA